MFGGGGGTNEAHGVGSGETLDQNNNPNEVIESGGVGHIKVKGGQSKVSVYWNKHTPLFNCVSSLRVRVICVNCSSWEKQPFGKNYTTQNKSAKTFITTSATIST